MGAWMLLISVLFFQQAPPAAPPKPASDPHPQQATPAEEMGQELLMVRRIFVEKFGDDAISKELQSMVITALSKSGSFIVTENREKADAVLKGSAMQTQSQELHAIGESTAVGTAAGGHSASVSGSVYGGSGTISGSSSGAVVARSLGTGDSQTSTETIDHAQLAVRLVNKDGDVVWTTTQESKGAKYKGAAADVADKVVKDLLYQIQKLKKKDAQP